LTDDALLSADCLFEVTPPSANALIEALRGVGYSLSTAAADLIDNSISAGARNVWLNFAYAGKDSTISLLDDGSGMGARELVRAMTLGARNPSERREANDLGRFGLGLKTASFSQCRRLTVASRRSGTTAVRVWDLDHVARTNDWQLLIGPGTGVAEHLTRLEAMPSGTLILLEKLDRILEGLPSGSSKDAFLALIDRVEDHLAMVFHRFLEGPSPDLRIFINGVSPSARIQPWDPFMSDSVTTVATPQEQIATARGTIGLRGFILPHKDFLGAAEAISGGGPEGWVAQQGFYVYRNRRMLSAGGWLGLGEERSWTREEPFKLARLRLDIPNTADDQWKIDIKKSTARPPSELRPRLKALAGHVRHQARQVFAHRGFYGRAPVVSDLNHAWLSITAGSAAAYRISRSHPAVRRLLDATASDPGAAEAALRVIEETVPVQRIWLDTVEKGEVKSSNFVLSPTPEIMEVLFGMYRHLTTRVGLTPEAARNQLFSSEPFQNFPKAIAMLGVEGPACGALP
jgi:hypothetical protein